MGTPGCYGKMHDDSANECRGCAFNDSCRVQYKEALRAASPVQAPPSPFAAAPKPAWKPPVQAPVQVWPLKPAVPAATAAPAPFTPFRRQYTPPQPVAQRQPATTQPAPQPASVQSPNNSPMFGGYADPLLPHLLSAPAPLVAQMDDETFGDALWRNTIGALASTTMMMMTVGVRQYFASPYAMRRKNPVEKPQV